MKKVFVSARSLSQNKYKNRKDKDKKNIESVELKRSIEKE